MVGKSKTLTWLLRHNAESCGVAIRSDGYCLVSDVLKVHKVKKTKLTLEEIFLICD
jgi:2'-phosphotransferase